MRRLLRLVAAVAVLALAAPASLAAAQPAPTSPSPTIAVSGADGAADVPAACVSSLERPECGSNDDVSGPTLALMFIVMGGMAFIVVRIALATRRRTQAKAQGLS